MKTDVSNSSGIVFFLNGLQESAWSEETISDENSDIFHITKKYFATSEHLLAFFFFFLLIYCNCSKYRLNQVI